MNFKGTNNMGKFLGLFEWRSQEHAGEDILLSLLDGELPITQSRRVQKHLERCWTCRARRDELQQAIGHFVSYRKQMIAPFLPPPPGGREAFLAKLDERIAARKQPWWVFPIRTFRRYMPTTMSPMIASLLVLSAAAVLLLVIWQRSTPPMSAENLLARAQLWDVHASVSAPQVGVVYQRVEIRTKHRKLDRAIYRDIAGKRKARVVALSSDEQAIKELVEAADVDWQRPLSVEGFEGFRSRQPIFSDKVTRTGDSLLTLTTSPAAGPIASESFTVRASDFHPVERRVEMRNDERIEIAELSYAVLGWSEVNEALFEPLQPGHPAAVAGVRPPPLPDVEQLDLAELQARLVLSRLNADSTEDLQFSRTPASVQVKGIVASTQRRNELIAALKQVPHVAPAIFSVEELNAMKAAQADASGVKAYSAVGRTSPLEMFFQDQGKDGAAVSDVSERLLDAAANVKQESHTIADLSLRFSGGSGLADPGRAAWNELLSRHAEKLASALDAEDALLRTNFVATPAGPQVAGAEAISPTQLADQADGNLILCRELISSNGGTPPRAAASIASDLLASIRRIRTMIPKNDGPN
jgi:anti-sigma factor RsiW